MEDEILRRLRLTREKLLREHGGFDNYFRYLQRIDREEFGAKNSPNASRRAANPSRRLPQEAQR